MEDLIDKYKGEKETKAIGFNRTRVSPVFNYIFMCKNCGCLFFAADVIEDAKKV